MTVSSNIPVNNYVGNNSTTTFDFDFLIEDSSQLKVQLTDSTGVQTDLTLDVDYTIHELGNEDGSYITYPKAGSTHTVLTDDETITLALNLEIEQEKEFKNSSKLNLFTLEYCFDYITRICQILDRKIQRAIKVNESTDVDTEKLVNAINAIEGDLPVINAVNANKTNINSAVANETNINTVASNISNVNAVGDDISSVVSVAGDLTNIDSVNANKTNIDTVSSNIANVNTVASNISAVNNVSSNTITINKVAEDLFGDNNIGTVAADIANVNAVAGDLTNIDVVNANKTNIDTVAGISSNVSTVAGIAANVSTVADVSTNIVAVDTNKTNINTVANDISSVVAVANDLTNIDSASTNAALSKQYAIGVPSEPAEGSAKYWAGQAAQGQVQADLGEADSTKKSFVKNKQLYVPSSRTVNGQPLTSDITIETASAFSDLSGNPYDNNALSNALNQKNDRLVAGEGIDISDILHTTLDVEKTGSFTIQNNYDGTKPTVGVEEETLTYQSLITSLYSNGTLLNIGEPINSIIPSKSQRMTHLRTASPSEDCMAVPIIINSKLYVIRIKTSNSSFIDITQIGSTMPNQWTACASAKTKNVSYPRNMWAINSGKLYEIDWTNDVSGMSPVITQIGTDETWTEVVSTAGINNGALYYLDGKNKTIQLLNSESAPFRDLWQIDSYSGGVTSDTYIAIDRTNMFHKYIGTQLNLLKTDFAQLSGGLGIKTNGKVAETSSGNETNLQGTNIKLPWNAPTSNQSGTLLCIVDGNLYRLTSGYTTFSQVGTDTDWIDVICSPYQTTTARALKSNGDVYSIDDSGNVALELQGQNITNLYGTITKENKQSWYFYTSEQQGWFDEDDTKVNLEDYQLEITSGTPADGDTLALTYTTIDTMTERIKVNSVANDDLSNLTLIGQAKFDSKVDVDSLVECQVVIDKYENGTEGYRIWSDGWCEQWGRVLVSSGITLTFLKTFRDTNYNFNITPVYNGSVDSLAVINRNSNRTTTSIGITYYQGIPDPSDWKASGYLAEGEY